MPGNPATPALFPFGVILELEIAPLPLVEEVAAVLEALLEALPATTGEGSGELTSAATATDGIEVGAIEAVELGEAVGLGAIAPGGP